MGDKKSSKSSGSSKSKEFSFTVKKLKKYESYEGSSAKVKANKVYLKKDKSKKTLEGDKAVKFCMEHSYENIYIGKTLSVWKDTVDSTPSYIFCNDSGDCLKVSEAKMLKKNAKQYGITNVKTKGDDVTFEIDGESYELSMSVKAVEFNTKTTPPSDDKNGAITRNTHTDTKVPESSSFQLTILNLLKSIDDKMDMLIKNTSSN